MDIKAIEEGLLSKNILFFNGEIDGNDFAYAKTSITHLYSRNSPNIIVMISSGGGSLESAFSIYDILRLYPGEKKALVCGAAFSAATIILHGCNERLATPNSHILLHNMKRKISLDILRDKVRLEKEIAEMEEMQLRWYEIIMKGSGKSLEQIKEEFAKEKKMNAVEALSFGLLDGIWRDPLPAEV